MNRIPSSLASYSPGYASVIVLSSRGHFSKTAERLTHERTELLANPTILPAERDYMLAAIQAAYTYRTSDLYKQQEEMRRRRLPQWPIQQTVEGAKQHSMDVLTACFTSRNAEEDEAWQKFLVGHEHKDANPF